LEIIKTEFLHCSGFSVLVTIKKIKQSIHIFQNYTQYLTFYILIAHSYFGFILSHTFLSRNFWKHGSIHWQQHMKVHHREFTQFHATWSLFIAIKMDTIFDSHVSKSHTIYNMI
jgi:hypothetical protein